MKLELDFIPRLHTVEYTCEEAGQHKFLSVFHFRCNVNKNIVSLLQQFGATFGGDFHYDIGVFDMDFFIMMLCRKLNFERTPESIFTYSDAGKAINMTLFRKVMRDEFIRVINDDDYRVNGIRDNWNTYVRPYMKDFA